MNRGGGNRQLGRGAESPVFRGGNKGQQQSGMDGSRDNKRAGGGAQMSVGQMNEMARKKGEEERKRREDEEKRKGEEQKRHQEDEERKRREEAKKKQLEWWHEEEKKEVPKVGGLISGVG